MSNSETEPNVQQMSNENINVSVTKEPSCKVKFEIFVQPKAVIAGYDKAIKNIKKEINIPGFRKGKAPDHYIHEKYTPALHKEWFDVVLNAAFNEALQLTHIHPLKEGNFSRPVIHACDKEKGAQLVVEFETRPTIPDINFEELKLKKVDTETVTPEAKNEFLNQVAAQFITYEPIEDRGIEEGDYADIDFDIFKNDAFVSIIKDRRVHVSMGQLPKWLYPLLLGVKAGENKEGETDEMGESSQSTTPMPFRATVKAIWKASIPPIDDELAKKAGLSSLEELNTQVQQRLENEKAAEAFEKQVKELEKFLLEKYQFELPQSIIDAGIKERLQMVYDQIKKNPQQNTLTRVQIEEQVGNGVRRNYQLSLILQKLAQHHQLDVTSEEIKEEFDRQLALYSSGSTQMDFSDKDALRNKIYSSAMQHKIEKFLLSKATFI